MKKYAVWCREHLHQTYTYYLEDGKAWMTGYYGEETEIEIPAEIDRDPVVGIAEWAFSSAEDINVIVPQSV